MRKYKKALERIACAIFEKSNDDELIIQISLRHLRSIGFVKFEAGNFVPTKKILRLIERSGEE